MKKSRKICLVLILAILILQATLAAQAPDRYFDTADVAHKEVRLSVCYPSVGTIKALAALRKAGAISLKEMIVVGVYHAKELTNYEDSKNYVRTNALDWFKFHKISADISEPVLFKKNACTPDFEAIFKKSDGIIFFGGPDIPSSIFKMKTSLLVSIEDPFRHYMELSFVFHLLGGSQDENFMGLLESRPAFPVLGICLGAQTLNVGTGGTLIQDIWSEVYGKMFVEDVIALGEEYWHKNPYTLLYPEENLSFYSNHTIALDPKSMFSKAMGFHPGDHPYVSSSHHQALDKMGKGFWVSATSLDGKIAEHIEHTRYPNVVGVQYHPERYSIWEGAPKYRFAPQDKEAVDLKTFMESHPPSMEFHKKIWAWLTQRLGQN
jgi:putative glutamine amidotransferase